jgi:DNA mismatch endonuclease, patch repair protein
MAAIRDRNTKPEMRVRTLLHSLGYRFRLHSKILPGKPDIVLPKHKTIIFVHGCFWHCHNCRWGTVVPKTRAEFWSNKRQGNVERDGKKKAALEALGWRVMTIWECQTRELEGLRLVLEPLIGPAVSVDRPSGFTRS